jgi:hypothetical protein
MRRQPIRFAVTARTVLTAFAAVLLAAPALAQDWADKMFEKRRHDYGTVALYSKAEARFKFKNVYKEDIHVAGVRCSCRCISAEAPIEQTLKTFETGEVVIAFNTAGGFLGHRTATATVIIDRPYYAEVRLDLAGNIRSELSFEPSFVELGTVHQGSIAEQKVVVRYSGGESWTIDDITSANKHFEVQMSQAGRGGGQTVYQLLVRLKDDAPAGYIKDQLTLVTRDRQRVPLYVQGRVVSEITVSPASLFFSDVEPMGKATKLLIVQGKKPFKITAVECEDKAFAFKVGSESATLHRVPVTFTARDKPGKLVDTIRIKTDLAKEFAGQCQVWATVIDSPPVQEASKEPAERTGAKP